MPEQAKKSSQIQYKIISNCIAVNLLAVQSVQIQQNNENRTITTKFHLVWEHSKTIGLIVSICWNKQLNNSLKKLQQLKLNE